MDYQAGIKLYYWADIRKYFDESKNCLKQLPNILFDLNQRTKEIISMKK